MKPVLDGSLKIEISNVRVSQNLLKARKLSGS